MPDPGTALHIASIDYACTFDALPEGGGAVSFSAPDPVHFTFTFETAQVQEGLGVIRISWNYAWFNQAQVEADIAGAMGAICQAVAELLALPITVVNAAVTIRRNWTIAPNLQGPGVGTGRVVSTDIMPYPTTVTDTDSCRAADAGELVTVA